MHDSARHWPSIAWLDQHTYRKADPPSSQNQTVSPEYLRVVYVRDESGAIRSVPEGEGSQFESVVKDAFSQLRGGKTPVSMYASIDGTRYYCEITPAAVTVDRGVVMVRAVFVVDDPVVV